MSSWTLLHALTGISYSIKLNQFSLAPKINPNNFQSFFITNSAWGSVNQLVFKNKVTVSIAVSFGELLVQSVKIAKLEKMNITEIKKCALLNSEKDVLNIKSKLNVSDLTLEISFLTPITITETLKLQIELA